MAYEPYLPATDMPRFLRELAEFVGLDDEEIDGVVRRAERLCRKPIFPQPDPSGRCYPGPMV